MAPPPSAKTTFLQWRTPRHHTNRTLARGIQRPTRSMPLSTSRAPDSSVRIDDVGVQLGTCQAPTQNLSRSSPELVKFRPRTCQVRAQRRKRCQNRLPHTIAPKGIQNVDLTFWNRTLWGAWHVLEILSGRNTVPLQHCLRYIDTTGRRYEHTTVSYTHLTLPTNREV